MGERKETGLSWRTKSGVRKRDAPNQERGSSIR